MLKCIIKLIPPSKEYENEIYDFKNEMLADGDDEFNGCGGLQRYSTLEEWKAHLDVYSDRNRIDPESNYVEGSQYMLVETSSRRVLGMVNLRHYLNEFLLAFGGHIGYSVRPTERGKGYGKLQLMLALEKLKAIGVNEALVTCDNDNAASYKTIEACGGTLENTVYSERFGCLVRRYWVR